MCLCVLYVFLLNIALCLYSCAFITQDTDLHMFSDMSVKFHSAVGRLNQL